MANAATSRATKPFATMWDADEPELVGVAPVLVPVPVPVGAAVDGKGVPVATAPTPPVTGPLSEMGTSFEPRALAAANHAS